MTRRADNCQAFRDDHQITHAVFGQLEARTGFGARENELDPGNRGDAPQRVVAHRRHRQIHGGVRPERTMMNDIRIGNRQDDARGAGAVPRIERILQEHDVGTAERVGLRIHSVIGGQYDGGAEHIEPAQACVENPRECVGGRGSRRVLVLHIIGRRQIHDVRPLALEQRDAGVEHEFRQRGAVHRRQRHPRQSQRVRDAVFRERHLIGFFRRKADALEPVTQQRSQLVLRRDDRDFGAGIGKRRKDRTGAQIFHVVHHDFRARFSIPEIISADAVHGRRHAGDDR